MKVRYKDPALQRVYAAYVAFFYDQAGPLYAKGAERRGSSHRAAFWDGFHGVPSLTRPRGSQGSVIYAAGKYFAKNDTRNFNVTTTKAGE